MFISDHIIGLCSWWFQFKKCVCPVVCVCNCHVVKRWVVQFSSICDCDWCWYAFCDFCTLLVFRSTAVVRVIITRTPLCVHTLSVHVQIHLPCCVYAGNYMEFQCFEVKPEDDSKEITECSYDDKPSTGMFAVSRWGNYPHWCSLHRVS